MDGIEVNNNFFRLSKHALLRANKRSITLEEIYEALYNPKSIRLNIKEGVSDAYAYIGRNGITVIVNREKSLIITLMRRSKGFSKARMRQKRNKRQVEIKRRYGNRGRK